MIKDESKIYSFTKLRLNHKNKLKLAIFIAVDLLLIGFSIWMITRPDIHFGNFAVLNPKGVIALAQRRLLVTATLLMLIAVIPAYFLTFFISWKYRAGHVVRERPVAEGSPPKYSPDFSNKWLIVLAWLIPGVIIFIIAGLIWKSTHDLDPYKPIESNIKPLTIQVVALRWKWLFIYPEQNIATVNFIQFPANTPISFELTADGPMNTFWIPQLGGQTYAMAAMSTKLHLMANQTGEFNGLSSEISGKGYSGMRFIAKSTSNTDFDAWVKSVQTSLPRLNLATYDELAKPSENNPQIFYSSVEKGLHNEIIMKYMTPSKDMEMK